MLKLVLGLLSGPLSSISSDIKEAYQSKLQAKNDAERVAADERIAVLEAQRATIIAGQSNPVERWIRPLFGLIAISYFGKVVFWDKVLGLGITDNLSPEFHNIFMIIVSGFFIDATVKRFIKK